MVLEHVHKCTILKVLLWLQVLSPTKENSHLILPVSENLQPDIILYLYNLFFLYMYIRIFCNFFLLFRWNALSCPTRIHFSSLNLTQITENLIFILFYFFMSQHELRYSQMLNKYTHTRAHISYFPWFPMNIVHINFMEIKEYNIVIGVLFKERLYFLGSKG